jgi:hypothetical protein
VPIGAQAIGSGDGSMLVAFDKNMINCPSRLIDGIETASLASGTVLPAGTLTRVVVPAVRSRR